MSSTSTPTEHDLVSVVIPIFNVEATLDECLRSVESQTHRELEIVCVIDGATDGSAAIAREHAAQVRSPPIQPGSTTSSGSTRAIHDPRATAMPRLQEAPYPSLGFSMIT